MPCDLASPFEVHSIDHEQNLVVVASPELAGDLHGVGLAPGPLNSVVVLILGDRDAVVNEISDFVHLRGDDFHGIGLKKLSLGDLLLNRLDLGDFLGARVLPLGLFLFFGHLLIGDAELLVQHIDIVAKLSPILVHLDEFVNDCRVLEPFFDGLSNKVGVATFIFSNQIDI